MEARAGGAGGGAGALLLVVEGGEDLHVGGCLGALHGDEGGVRAGEVVQARGCEELLVEPDHLRGLRVEGVEIVECDVGTFDAGELGEVAEQPAVRHCGEDGLQVRLLVEVEGVVDSPVEVHGKLRNAADGSGLHEVLLAVGGDEAPGDAEIAVEPRVEQRATIDFDTDLRPARRLQQLPRLHFEGGRICVRTDDARAGLVGKGLRRDPGDDGTLPHDEVLAGNASPGLSLVKLRETSVDKALGDIRRRVVRRGRGADEVGEVRDVVEHRNHLRGSARSPVDKTVWNAS